MIIRRPVKEVMIFRYKQTLHHNIYIIIRIIRIVMIMIVDQCNNLPDEERKKVPGSSSGLTWSSIIIITIFISLFLTMIMIVRIIIIFNVPSYRTAGVGESRGGSIDW